MAVVASEQGQDVCSILLLDEELTPVCFSLLQKPNQVINNQITSVSLTLDCQDCIALQMGNIDDNPTCTVDVDVDKGNCKSSAADEEENAGISSREGVLNHLQKVMQRQISVHVGGKFVQLLFEYFIVLLRFSTRDKSASERVHDTPNNKCKKYKRVASFNSRRVALLFSVLSSIGTIILIYLTLRVRQMGGHI